MVTEARRYPTEEETREGLAVINRQREQLQDATDRGIEEGIAHPDSRLPVTIELTPARREAVEWIVSMAFGSHDPEGPHSEEALAVAEGLATTVAGSPLLIKLVEAWYLEGQIFDWIDNPDGIAGRAIDRAIEVLNTYREKEPTAADRWREAYNDIEKNGLTEASVKAFQDAVAEELDGKGIQE